jgi:hypothetical protein
MVVVPEREVTLFPDLAEPVSAPGPSLLPIPTGITAHKLFRFHDDSVMIVEEPN